MLYLFNCACCVQYFLNFNLKVERGDIFNFQTENWVWKFTISNDNSYESFHVKKISFPMLGHTTTRSISFLCHPTWYIEVDTSAIRKVSHENWNYFVVRLHRTATVTDRSIALSINLSGRTHVEKNCHW
jgi:hypothetical protein